MSRASIFHLEKFPHFLRRVTDLNRLYSPDDAMHELLLLDEAGWAKRQRDDQATAAVAVRKLLHRIHQNFPAGAPVHEQGAYLLRAFAASRPFAEANFRTGYDYVAELVEHNGNSLVATHEDRDGLANTLWDRVQEHFGQGPLTPSRLLNRDAIFDYLAGWCENHID